MIGAPLTTGSCLRSGAVVVIFTVVVSVTGARAVSASTQDVPRRLRALPLTADFTSVSQGAGRWVAVGDEGAIFTSENGTNWSSVGPESRSISFLAVAHAGGRWVAVGDEGAIFTSENGTNWNSVGPESSSSRFLAVAHAGGRWVTVGDEGAIFTSENGTDWSSVRPESSSVLFAVAHAGGRWVAVGGDEGAIFTSENGTDWSVRPESSSIGLYTVAHAGGRWVAVGIRGGIFTSKNGTDWSSVRPESSSSELSAVTHAGGRWVAVGERGAIFTSENGTDWSSVGPESSSISFRAVAHAGGRWVAVGLGGAIFTSENGTDWSSAGPGLVYIQFVAVAHSGWGWVAVGTEGSIFTSENGTDWSSVRPESSSIGLYAVAHAGGRWVAGGDEGSIVTSENGTDWSSVRLKSNLIGFLAVAHAGGRWVAVGTEGSIVTSENGTDWSSVGPESIHINFHAVAHSGGRWVAVGDEGAIFTSENGTDWSSVGPGLFRINFSAVAHAGGRWVAVGTEGAIFTSENGMDWSSVGPEWSSIGLYALAHAGGRWLVMGTHSYLLIPGSELPRVENVRFEFGNVAADRVFLEIAGETRSCAGGVARVVLRAQNDHNFSKKRLSVGPVGASAEIKLVDHARRTVAIDVDLGQTLGIRPDDPFWYSAIVECGSEATTYPRFQAATREIYRPTPWPTWIWLLIALMASILVVLILYGLHPILVLTLWSLPRRIGPLGDVQVPGIGVKLAELMHALNLFVIPVLVKRPRTLDAWVERHRRRWDERGFKTEPTAARSTGYVPLPLRLHHDDDGELVDRPGPELMSRLWTRDTPVVEVSGVGGAGKTMFTIQLCRWALEGAGGRGAPRRLPVLIEEDTSDLLASVRRKLQAGLGMEVDEDLIKALLAQGRLLVVFDRLSERSEQTFRYVETMQGTLRAGAVLVSSRRQGSYEGSEVLRCFPVPLRSASLMFFMASLLRDRDRGQAFERLTEQTELARRLAGMIVHDGQELPLTPLLVRLFVERAIELAEGGRSLDDLPASVPEAHFEYLRRVNVEDRSVPHHLPHEEMFRAARVLAVESLGDSFVPQDIAKEKARECLAAAGWSEPDKLDPIERLKLNGVLVERSVGARYFIAFSLDPVAEYLAADEHIERCRGNPDELSALFERVRAKGEAVEGFLVALALTKAFRESAGRSNLTRQRAQ